MVSASKIVLLVCEGPTDIEVISELTRVISLRAGNPVEIREISPCRDKTSGNYPSQGWTEVKAWCERYSVNKNVTIPKNIEPWRATLLQQKLAYRWDNLIKFSNASGIIVQIDTDIAEQMTHANFVTSVKSRKPFCFDAINTWLNESNKPPEFHYLLSTFSTETWLLATHESTDAGLSDLHQLVDYESIPNVEERLIGLGYAKKKNNGIFRLKKDPVVYKQYGQRVAQNIDKVRGRCSEADVFYNYIFNL